MLLVTGQRIRLTASRVGPIINNTRRKHLTMRVAVFIVLSLTVGAGAAEPKRAGPDWWSLQPIKKPVPPVIANLPVHANAIDAFVRERLGAAGLTPTQPADRLTLIRRVTFDLTGLPPTPTEIDAFLADQSPAAFERVVDRLLASPAYGERWARHWLDIVRYAESHGFEYDRLRDHAWRYRDYVIRSFNADNSYSRFVREQIAGDALPDATRDSVVATGMLVAGPYDQAGMGSVSPIVKGKAREDELEDLLATVGQTFLGATINCARCHDHKFDPFTAKDYYRLKAVFDGVIPGERPITPPEELKNRQATIDRLQRQAAEARVKVGSIEALARQEVLKKRKQPAMEESLVNPIAQWAFSPNGRDAVGSLHADLKGGAKIVGGRLIVDGKQAFAASAPLTKDLTTKTLEAWVNLPTLMQGGGGVMSVQTLDGRTFDGIVFAERKSLQWMAGSDGYVRTQELNGPAETAKSNELVHIAIAYAADGRIATYRNGQPYGKAYVPAKLTSPVTFRAKEAQVVFGMRHAGGGNAFLNGEIEEARLYDVALTAEQVHASFRAGMERVSLAELRAAMSMQDRADHDAATMQINRLENEMADLRKTSVTYAANPRQPGQTLLLKRGDIEKPGEPVTPGSPTVVKGLPAVDLPADALEGSRRLAFADWVVHPDNPLTWRVLVNRVWQHHFGEGLVRTPNDFGFNGERPTHPELLDWLATEFRDSGGQLKPLHRLIVTSATYRQASTPNEKASATDAENRLLWRFAPQRLEAEAVRDTMLSVSNKLNGEVGGPSFRPFRIETFNSAFYIPFDEDRPDLNRRSVYRMNVTSARDPVLEVLDCPDPSVKTPRRSVTTTPLQALTLMNNPFTERMARAFAGRVTRDAGDDIAAQVVLAYRLAFGRKPTEAEANRTAKVVRETGLKPVCWALLNASEFVYVK
jgi:Protein of unknown function (DUF1553)/Protein of unknown function (DUF1549)/Concanavalin A-like lectin/glucanases superfamily